MRKEILTFGMAAMAALGAAAQVGVNTETPKTTLDIVQTDTLTVGKGKGFRLIDGNQAEGRILTSDADGVGTWKSGASMRMINGFIGVGINIPFLTNIATWYYTGSYIDLPPGMWRVDVSMLVRSSASGAVLTANDFLWLRSSFSDSGSVLALSSDFVGNNHYVSASLQGPSIGTLSRGMMTGSVVIYNTLSTTKRYYYIAGSTEATGAISGCVITTFGGTAWAENVITAFPISVE
jgi:hypothetical protein